MSAVFPISHFFSYCLLSFHRHTWVEPGSIFINPSCEVFLHFSKIPLGLLFCSMNSPTSLTPPPPGTVVLILNNFHGFAPVLRSPELDTAHQMCLTSAEMRWEIPSLLNREFSTSKKKFHHFLFKGWTIFCFRRQRKKRRQNLLLHNLLSTLNKTPFCKIESPLHSLEQQQNRSNPLWMCELSFYGQEMCFLHSQFVTVWVHLNLDCCLQQCFAFGGGGGGKSKMFSYHTITVIPE